MLIKKYIFNAYNLMNYFFAVLSSYAICYIFMDFEKYAPITLPLSLLIFFIVRLVQNALKEEFAIIKSKRSNLFFVSLIAIFVSIGTILNRGVDDFFNTIFGGFIESIKSIACFTGIFIISLWGVTLLLSFFIMKLSKESVTYSINKLKFWHLFVAFMIVYFFWFFCNYPGYITPDNYAQLHMFEPGGKLNNHHPVLHSLLIYLTVDIIGHGNVTPYFAFQIPIMSAIFAYTVKWIGEHTKSSAIYWLSLFFFLLFPLNWIAASSMVKDFLFGSFVLLLTVSIAEIIFAQGNFFKNPRKVLIFLVSLIGTAFLRNNGIFILIIIALVVPFAIKKYRMRFVSLVITIILLFAFTTIVVYPACNIDKGSIIESLGVPLQQISRTVCDDGNISEDEKAYINNIIPIEIIKDEYNPSCVDSIKFNKNFDSTIIENDTGYFLKIWFNLLLKNPESYFTSYFELTQMLWNPFYESGVYEDFSKSDYFTEISQKKVIPFFPDLISKIISFSQYSSYTGIIHPIWNPACYLILSFIIALLIKIRKSPKYIACFVPCWTLWITLLLATPIASAGRYMYSFFVCMPVFLSIPLIKERVVVKSLPKEKQ